MSFQLNMPISKRNIIIVGGSLAGLMHGILLRTLGNDVTILEQEDNQRESHMAGVCCAWDFLQFLDRYDRIDQVANPFCLQSARLQSVDKTGQIDHYFPAPRLVTSWDALYWRLRANFDGFASSFYPNPPPIDFPGAGKGTFLANHRMLEFQTTDEGLYIQYEDLRLDTKAIHQVRADLLLGADGPNSSVRQRYLPDTRREFAGYVAWRGRVQENKVSPQTRATFSTNVTLDLMKDGHALVYMIPGKNGSMSEGDRMLNFLWYTNESPESHAATMTDTHGHRHNYIVPAGIVDSSKWAALQERGKRVLSKSHQEVCSKIEAPFVQTITDFVSPRAAFEGGRVLLVGDSLSLFRPHTASSTNQAAFHCLTLERLMRNEITVSSWEDEVLSFARLHCRRSVWYGENYQRPLQIALFSALPYWTSVLLDFINSCVFRNPSRLRW